jgi:hypothetical protein
MLHILRRLIFEFFFNIDKINDNVFMEILEEIETKKFVLQQRVDQKFFSKAMFLASKNYFPSFIGHKIYNILLNMNKNVFMGKQMQVRIFQNYTLSFVLLVIYFINNNDTINFHCR